MKLSVSLPEDDVALLDEHARSAGLPSRSAAVRQAIRLLRSADLDADYEAAWNDWRDSGDQEAWEAVVSDGLT